jgi:hypothetical protein
MTSHSRRPFKQVGQLVGHDGPVEAICFTGKSTGAYLEGAAPLMIT